MDTDRDVFWRDGFVILRGVFTAPEVAALKAAIAANAEMAAATRAIKSTIATGTRPSFRTIFVWNDTSGNDIFAKATRRDQIFSTIARLLDDAVYVYHNKIALKHPGIVGFPWHQDYAYWYRMGNLYPDMATVAIAVDPMTEVNGCMRMLVGSHRLGRIDHLGDLDDGADPRRLAVIRTKLPETPVILDAGDAVIFHGNTIHGSADNTSETSRLTLLGCYNSKHNSPYLNTSGHPGYIEQFGVSAPITTEDIGKLPIFR